MRGKKKQFWECPVCHVKFVRKDWILIMVHMDEHPNNQKEFGQRRRLCLRY